MVSAEHPIEEPVQAFCPHVLNLKKGAEGAAKIIFRKEDPENLKKKTQEYIENFATPYQAARHGLIEQVIEPRETRPMIIRALKMLEGKKEDRPWKKHGNIPL